MPDVKFEDHDGKKILIINFSNAQDSQSIIETAEEAMRLVRSSNQQRSVRGLLDFSGISFNKVVRETMKKMSRNNRPYMKSVAFIGLGGLLSPLFRVLLFVSGKSNHRVFGTRNDALNWLVKN
jgi:hypothetical protein